MKMDKVVFGVIGALLLSGCSQRVADLTIASTKNYNINGNHFAKGARVKGDDSAPVVIFPLGIPNVKAAADKAIERNKCAVALSDVVVTQYTYAFLFGKFGFTVEGDLVLDKSKPGCESAS